MCGRFAVTATPSMLAAHFGLSEPVEFTPNYNITPSQQIPVVRSLDGKRGLFLMRWGLIPHWAKDVKIGYKLINARAGTVFDKPAFREAIKKRRCLIPASGFFEWKKAGKMKQPYFVALRGQDLFAFAGLWEFWHKSKEEIVASCSILTTDANEIMAPIHHRMPAIIAPENYDAWLRPDARPEDLSRLLKPFRAAAMKAYPVSQAINNPKNNSAACLAPLEEN